jgi:hypothetical protein
MEDRKMNPPGFLQARLWTLACASMLLAGCNGGLIAIASDSSGGGGNSQPVVSDLEVPRSATSPASIFFVVFDQEGNPTDVQIRYRRGSLPGSVFEGITLGPASNPLTGIPSHAGVPYEVEWNFAADLGGEAYQAGLEIQVGVDGGVSPPVLTGVSMGNDLPTLVSAGPLPAGDPEYGGNVDVGFTVSGLASRPSSPSGTRSGWLKVPKNRSQIALDPQ